MLLFALLQQCRPSPVKSLRFQKYAIGSCSSCSSQRQALRTGGRKSDLIMKGSLGTLSSSVFSTRSTGFSEGDGLCITAGWRNRCMTSSCAGVLDNVYLFPECFQRHSGNRHWREVTVKFFSLPALYRVLRRLRFMHYCGVGVAQSLRRMFMRRGVRSCIFVPGCFQRHARSKDKRECDYELHHTLYRVLGGRRCVYRHRCETTTAWHVHAEMPCILYFSGMSSHAGNRD